MKKVQRRRGRRWVKKKTSRKLRDTIIYDSQVFLILRQIRTLVGGKKNRTTFIFVLVVMKRSRLQNVSSLSDYMCSKGNIERGKVWDSLKREREKELYVCLHRMCNKFNVILRSSLSDSWRTIQEGLSISRVRGRWARGSESQVRSVHDSIWEWVLDPGQHSMPSAPSLVIFTFFTSMISFPPSLLLFFDFADDLLSHSRLSSHDLLFCRLRVSFRWFIWSPSSTVIESVQPAILSFCVALSLSFSRMISIPDFIFVIPVRDLGGRDEEKRKQTDWNNLILIMVRKREKRSRKKKKRNGWHQRMKDERSKEKEKERIERKTGFSLWIFFFLFLVSPVLPVLHPPLDSFLLSCSLLSLSLPPTSSSSFPSQPLLWFYGHLFNWINGINSVLPRNWLERRKRKRV